MILALVMTAGLGEWLCLQREMQDIQLNFTGGGICCTDLSAVFGFCNLSNHLRAAWGFTTVRFHAGRGRGSGATVSLSEGPPPMSFAFDKPGSVSRS